MSCYQCGGPDGTEFVLCPTCRSERSKIKVTVKDTINSSESGIKPYLRIIIQEWHLAVGGVVMVIVAINALVWFLLHPELPFDPTGLYGPDGDTLYKACMEQIQSTPLDTIDTAALVAAYKDQLNPDASATPMAYGEAPDDVVRAVLEIRAKEACTAAKSTCETKPDSPECADVARTYMNKD
jgi:hypothetical protein